MREMMGISVSPEMRASLYTPFYSTDFDLFRSLNQVYLAFCEVRVPCGRDMPPLPSDSK